ncbi:hypothetical protein AAY473_013988 [Plecturocebus cupreus]
MTPPASSSADSPVSSLQLTPRDFALMSPEMGSHDVALDGLELLDSSHLPTSASQYAGIIHFPFPIERAKDHE